MEWRDLSTLNAGLNTLSAIFLSTGWFFIRRRNVPAHRRCMLAAFATSTVFLISYLTYHAKAGAMPFPGEGGVRTLYLTILLTHTVLAAAALPLVLITLAAALRQRLDRHRRLARWTLPIWLYVSVTGVVVYWMLYHGGFG